MIREEARLDSINSQRLMVRCEETRVSNHSRTNIPSDGEQFFLKRCEGVLGSIGEFFASVRS